MQRWQDQHAIDTNALAFQIFLQCCLFGATVPSGSLTITSKLSGLLVLVKYYAPELLHIKATQESIVQNACCIVQEKWLMKGAAFNGIKQMRMILQSDLTALSRKCRQQKLHRHAVSLGVLSAASGCVGGER